MMQMWMLLCVRTDTNTCQCLYSRPCYLWHIRVCVLLSWREAENNARVVDSPNAAWQKWKFHDSGHRKWDCRYLRRHDRDDKTSCCGWKVKQCGGNCDEHFFCIFQYTTICNKWVTVDRWRWCYGWALETMISRHIEILRCLFTTYQKEWGPLHLFEEEENYCISHMVHL